MDLRPAPRVDLPFSQSQYSTFGTASALNGPEVDATTGMVKHELGDPRFAMARVTVDLQDTGLPENRGHEELLISSLLDQCVSVVFGEGDALGYFWVRCA